LRLGPNVAAELTPCGLLKIEFDGQKSQKVELISAE